MAEEKKNDAKASVDGFKVIAKGPTNRTSKSEVLRFQPDNARKKQIDIREGQILNVGKDITNEEADRLLGLNIWKFERVNE